MWQQQLAYGISGLWRKFGPQETPRAFRKPGYSGQRIR